MPPRVTKKSERPLALPEDDDAFVRLPIVLSVYPVGETTWNRGVQSGRFPKPIKLSPRVNAWRVGGIRKLLQSVGEEHPGR